MAFSLKQLVLSSEKGYRIGRHVLFWSMCVLFFGTIYGGFWQLGPNGQPWDSIAFVEAILFLPPHMFLGYSIIYILFPKYLFTQKYFQLTVGVIGLILVTAFLSYLTARFIITPVRHWQDIPPPRNTLAFAFMAGLRGSNTVAGFVVAIKLAKYWYFKTIEIERLEQQKLRAELEVLKGQLQPHFLFNTLNNLYSLILQKSADAPQVVLRLSDLLRYMLTESSRNKIDLQKELTILNDYMALEQLRFGKRLELTCKVHGDLEKKLIAPLILLPFVENAFKHGAGEMLEQPWMSLDVRVDGNQLRMKLINGKADMLKPYGSSTGIGLHNVSQRLDLLYPGKHELETLAEKEAFIVNLTMELESA